MLSGEGNARERWKTTIGVISRKATLHVQRTSFVHFCAVVLQDLTTWNFQKLLCYTFFGGDFVPVLVHFFSLPLIFTLHWWPLAFLILSPPLQNFLVVLPPFLFFFISRPRPLPPFSRWASLACRLLSLYLCLSLALYSKFVDMTINLSLIL